MNVLQGVIYLFCYLEMCNKAKYITAVW